MLLLHLRPLGLHRVGPFGSVDLRSGLDGRHSISIGLGAIQPHRGKLQTVLLHLGEDDAGTTQHDLQ